MTDGESPAAMPHFEEALTILRDRSTDLFGMGRSFEHLMQAALSREPGILGGPLFPGVVMAGIARPRRPGHGYRFGGRRA